MVSLYDHKMCECLVMMMCGTLHVSSVLNKCLAFYFPADKNMSRDSTDTEVSCSTDNMICKYVCPSFSIFQLSK